MNATMQRILEPAGVKPPPYVKEWRDDPPTQPGTYQWRRSPLWEPITREVPSSMTVFSQRYENQVPIARLEGQWFY